VPMHTLDLETQRDSYFHFRVLWRSLQDKRSVNVPASPADIYNTHMEL